MRSILYVLLGIVFLFGLAVPMSAPAFADPTLPSITTLAATSVGSTSATLNENLTSTGGEDCDRIGFIYYPTTSHPVNPGNVEPTSLGYATTAYYSGGTYPADNYSRPISSLSICTTYYFRAYTHNSAGHVYGDELSFTTICLPGVTTNAATSISCSRATLNGNVSSLGGDSDIGYWGFVWGTTSHINPGNTYVEATLYDHEWHQSGSRGTGPLDRPITGLVAGATYYYRACAWNSAGWAYGDEVSFTTINTDPTPVWPRNAQFVARTSIPFSWMAVTGATKYWVQVSTDPAFATTFGQDNAVTGTGKTFAGFPNDGTKYYWRVKAYVGGAWGTWSTQFWFISVSPPTLVSPADAAHVNQANITFTWNAVSGANNYRCQISTSDNFTTLAKGGQTTVTTKTYYNFARTGTTYYWRVGAYSPVAAKWGQWSTVRRFVNGP